MNSLAFTVNWLKFDLWHICNMQHASNYAQQNQQLKTNSSLENQSYKKSLQSFLQKINNREKEEYFNDQQEQQKSELRKTVFWKKKYCRVSKKVCVRCKFKDHAELNCSNSWFIFSRVFFSEASSASNNIFIVDVSKKDLA